MCEQHDHAHDSAETGLSRRSLGLLALAAGGMTLVPFGAKAAEVDNLAIMCIDFRLVDQSIKWLNSHMPAASKPPRTREYDLVALAGASLAGVAAGLFEPTTHGFWQQVFAADKLHDIKRVYVLDHMGCGAFKEEFNNGVDLPAARERKLHIDMMTALDAKLRAYYPELTTREFWLWPDPKTTRPYPTQPERITLCTPPS
ncbi:MAG TPA: hypothetical protein VG889_08355 [Rhizomicrobium sp.]|nr:hypothetical protein [Rhizomicrobium sp.]